MADRRPQKRDGRQPTHGPKPAKTGRRSSQTAPRAGGDKPVGEERLQKVLAHAGVGSRRACEEVILQGRVTIDGKVVRQLGSKVDPRTAQIAVDGQKIHLERMVYYAVNKPKGYVSTNHDPGGRPRVIDLLPEIPQRVYTVGRLDEMSTGLMLLTNDGELANKLAHPKYGVEKLYRAVVAGDPDREVLNKLTEGVWLAEGKVRAKHVRAVAKKGEATVLELVLAEGKNREVRRMLAKFGHKVMALTRVAVGPISIKGLTPGSYRPLSGQEVDLLRKVAAGIAISPRHSERKPRHTRPSPPAKAAGGPRAKRTQEPEGPESRRPRRKQSGGAKPREREDRRSGPPERAPGGQRHPSARSTGAVPNRSAGPPASSRRGQRDGGPGRRPQQGGLVLPEGPPPSQRRSQPPSAEPPGRRIIGLAPEPRRPAQRRPRPAKPKKRFPRSALGRRPGPGTDGGDDQD